MVGISFADWYYNNEYKYKQKTVTLTL